jgi:hypothetical protein
LLLAARPAGAQHVALGPQAALVDYREVTAGLRYRGTGWGGAASARWGRFSAGASVVRLSLDPAPGSAATRGFAATEVDAHLGYDVADYASVEVGILRRSAESEFAAQSVGAVRLGARSAYALGPGATVAFRAGYLVAPRFSGGGHAPVALEFGLGLDVRLLGRVRGAAAYQFQRINRKTNPGGTGEVDAPIQESLARVGLALALGR